MTDPHSEDALEVCRRVPSDLSSPETRELAARLKSDPELRAAFEDRLERDSAVKAALQRVTLPGTDRSRLVEKIRASLEQQAVATAEPVAKSVAARPERGAFYRYAAILTVLTASVALIVWAAYPRKWSQVGAQQLATWAMTDWQPNTSDWRRMHLSSESELDGVSVSNWLRRSPARWQPLATHLDQSTKVYEIPSKKRASRLFVLHADHRVAGLPSRPPQQPQTEQEGWLFAAWQEDSRVFVLSVPGPVRNYWDVIQSQSALSSDQTRDADSVRN